MWPNSVFVGHVSARASRAEDAGPRGARQHAGLFQGIGFHGSQLAKHIVTESSTIHTSASLVQPIPCVCFIRVLPLLGSRQDSDRRAQRAVRHGTIIRKFSLYALATFVFSEVTIAESSKLSLPIAAKFELSGLYFRVCVPLYAGVFQLVSRTSSV